MSVLGVCLIILMINLYFFVEDPAVAKTEAPQPEAAPKQNFTRAPKKPTFMATEEVDMAQLQSYLEEFDDRILVVAFEEANAEGSRRQLWKRWERIARAIPKKNQFKRSDEEDMPKIVRFDCTLERRQACEQLVGKNLPAVVLWKSKVPRFFPEEVRTDTHVFNYLAEQMKESVSYTETLDDAELFTTDEGIRLFYFGRDESNAYRKVADVMRDIISFGRTADAEIAEAFEADVPSLRMYRPFDDSPVFFNGNVSNDQEISAFVRENSVPKFGEWTAKTVKMYQNRKLPVVFIAIDPTEDESEGILEVGKALADELWGTFSFTYLDAIMNADLARRLGATELPEVLILTGTEIRQKIDLDAPEQSIRTALKDWQEASLRGPETADLDDEYDYEEYDDADYEAEDLDEDYTEEDGSDEEEEEKEEL